MIGEAHKAICLIQVHFVILHEMMEVCFHQSSSTLINNHPYYSTLGTYSNGLVRVPHQVRKRERPTVSKMRAMAPTATVSNGRFSVKTWAMNCYILASAILT